MLKLPGFNTKNYSLILTQDRVRQAIFHIEDINNRSGLDGRVKVPEHFKLLGSMPAKKGLQLLGYHSTDNHLIVL